MKISIASFVLGLVILWRSIVWGSIIVKAYPADKFNLLNTNTEFVIEPEERF
jgi:hypothetical protein